MTIHTPAVQPHHTPIGVELLGAAVIGIFVTIAILLVVGSTNIDTTIDWSFASEPQFSAEFGQLEQRHGEQGWTELNAGWSIQRQGEIAGS
jgi:hypothetical protein